MKKTNVEKDITKEILENCSWVERIWVRLNLKLCIKIYRKGLQDKFNCKYGKNVNDLSTKTKI